MSTKYSMTCGDRKISAGARLVVIRRRIASERSPLKHRRTLFGPRPSPSPNTGEATFATRRPSRSRPYSTGTITCFQTLGQGYMYIGEYKTVAKCTTVRGYCHRASSSRSLLFLFNFLFPPLYPTSSLSFSFHTLTTNDKTIKHDDIDTLWPSNTWWPKELLDRMLHRPRNIQRSVPHRPLPRRDPSPHQAGDSQEESPQKPMPLLPA